MLLLLVFLELDAEGVFCIIYDILDLVLLLFYYFWKQSGRYACRSWPLVVGSQHYVSVATVYDSLLPCQLQLGEIVVL